MLLQQTPDDSTWNDQFAAERERLITALGAMTEGGIVAHAEHVGATSVPGLFGQPYVDIALHVWPFPLEEPALHALVSRGYEIDPEFADAPEQRFHHPSAPFRLHAVEFSPLWMNYLVVREYLRHDAAARQAFSARKQEWSGVSDPARYREAKRLWLDQHLADARRSWIEREGFARLYRVAEELRDLPVPWHISSGWALDLFLGRVTRVHEDVDVEVSRADQLVLQEYMTSRGWTLLTPFEERLQPWPLYMRLESPRHQAHAHRDGAFIDFLLADLDGGVWRYRREPTITRDMSRAHLQSDDGIPYLAPELVLLYKSTTHRGIERDKDQADFETAYAELEPERRAWLRWALMAANPSHHWIERL